MALIASKGTPVAISGTCLLVELWPRFGYFDSDIVDVVDGYYRSLISCSSRRRNRWSRSSVPKSQAIK